MTAHPDATQQDVCQSTDRAPHVAGCPPCNHCRIEPSPNVVALVASIGAEVRRRDVERGW